MSSRHRTRKNLTGVSCFDAKFVADLDPAIGQIEGAPARSDGSPLEAGYRPSLPTRCPASPVVFVAEGRVIVQDVAHLPRVVLPVGGHPPDCAEPHPGGDKIGEVSAEQPTLAVPRFVPW